jgi:hypothetical protein
MMIKIINEDPQEIIEYMITYLKQEEARQN